MASAWDQRADLLKSAPLVTGTISGMAAMPAGELRQDTLAAQRCSAEERTPQSSDSESQTVWAYGRTGARYTFSDTPGSFTARDVIAMLAAARVRSRR